MTRELKFTSESFGVGKAEDDCYLDASYPIHEFLITGKAQQLNHPKTVSVVEQANEHQRKLEQAKAQGRSQSQNKTKRGNYRAATVLFAFIFRHFAGK